MIYVWNTSFEGFPAGSKQGNTMGEALRRLKAAFYERYIIDHTISEGAAPTSIHNLGQCTIVHIEEDTPASLYIDGGLQYKSPAFYRDDGSALTDFLPDTHTEFTDLTTDVEHPQYVPVAGGDVSANGLTWTLDNLTGLETAGEQYNARSGSVDQAAVQGGLAHTSAAADTYAKHKASCVVVATSKTVGSFYIGYGKYQNTAHSDLSDAGGVLDLTSLGHITIPTTNVGTYTVHPHDGAGVYGLILIEGGAAQFTATFMELD